MLNRLAYKCRFASQNPNKLSIIEDFLKKFRIYKDEPVKDLLAYLSMLNVCTIESFTKNAESIYSKASKYLGKTRVEQMTQEYFAKRFIGGDSLEKVLVMVKSYNDKGFSTIANFAIECKTDGHYTFEEMENFTEIYIHTLQEVSKFSNLNSTAMKFSALVEEHLLLALNKVQQDMLDIFRKFPHGIGIPFAKFISKMEKKGYNFSLEEQEQIKSTFNVKDDIIEWKSWPIYAHVFNIKSPCLPLLRVAGIKDEEVALLTNFTNRLHRIFGSGKENGCSVMVDAEQSYLQFIFSSITEQFQTIYNKEDVVVLNTIQNYLKESVLKIEEEIRRHTILNIPFGFKMVRGAYMSEENRISLEKGIESPVCDSYEQTTFNFSKNLSLLNENLIEGSNIVIASHNFNTNDGAFDYPNKCFSHAQLLGLGDHLSFWLQQNNKRVYKYIPFGKLDVLMPYLLRRAQESSDMMKKNTITSSLVIDEIKKRFPKSKSQ